MYFFLCIISGITFSNNDKESDKLICSVRPLRTSESFLQSPFSTNVCCSQKKTKTEIPHHSTTPKQSVKSKRDQLESSQSITPKRRKCHTAVTTPIQQQQTPKTKQTLNRVTPKRDKNSNKKKEDSKQPESIINKTTPQKGNKQETHHHQQKEGNTPEVNTKEHQVSMNSRSTKNDANGKSPEEQRNSKTLQRTSSQQVPSSQDSKDKNNEKANEKSTRQDNSSKRKESSKEVASDESSESQSSNSSSSTTSSSDSSSDSDSSDSSSDSTDSESEESTNESSQSKDETQTDDASKDVNTNGNDKNKTKNDATIPKTQEQDFSNKIFSGELTSVSVAVVDFQSCPKITSVNVYSFFIPFFLLICFF